MVNQEKRTTSTIPHSNPLVNAITYITCSLMSTQIINESKVKTMCQKRFEGVTDEIFEEALDVLYKGLVILKRENGYACQTHSAPKKATPNHPIDLPQSKNTVVEEFKRLSQVSS